MSFDPKDPAEIVPMTFDFAAVCADIAVAAVTITYVRGAADPNPCAMLAGAPQIVGTQVRQKVAGGIDAALYALRAEATTSTGLKFVLAGLLPVRTA